jgi:hypothetical protein
MIKRFGAIILTLLYVITVSGFALNLHYCFNRVYSVNIDAPVKGCSTLATCKMKCCHNQHIEVKVKDAHQGQSLTFLRQTFSYTLPRLPFADYYSTAKQNALNRTFNKDLPDPPLNGSPVFIKNRILRI